MILALIGPLVARYLLVMLFLPFSALDKILNFRGATAQASLSVPQKLAPLFVVAGLCVEILMPLGIMTGIADKLAAFIMAGYCGVTALLWKQFWKPGDFWVSATSQGRLIFWDFLKNISVAGGFLLLVVGAHGNLQSFIDHPLASSHPYQLEAPE